MGYLPRGEVSKREKGVGHENSYTGDTHWYVHMKQRNYRLLFVTVFNSGEFQMDTRGIDMGYTNTDERLWAHTEVA